MTQQSNVQDSPGAQSDLELLKLILMDILTRLEDRKLSLDREIGNYPTPIPQCDAQFNYLLDQRTRLSQQLSRLRAACQESLAPDDYVDLILGFLRDLVA
jgi:hypothetical protein